ncbi:MAG: hypothetical protein JJ992_00585, partial [Planctomycetes bacterium]|nr:hypothetical protein [Planctomycetota bacterium]
MKRLRTFVEEILHDQKIDEAELLQVCDYIMADDVLDMQDVELLVQLYTRADSYPPEFEKLFFGALKAVMLDDDKIVDYERFLLMQMLYANRTVRKIEIEFLEDLRREASEVSPEFD